jgi:hypothetical protein
MSAHLFSTERVDAAAFLTRRLRQTRHIRDLPISVSARTDELLHCREPTLAMGDITAIYSSSRRKNLRRQIEAELSRF